MGLAGKEGTSCSWWLGRNIAACTPTSSRRPPEAAHHRKWTRYTPQSASTGRLSNTGQISSTVRPDLVVGITALIFSSAEDREQVVAQETDGNEGCGPLRKNCAVGDAEDLAVAALLGPTRPEILLGPAF